MHRPARRRSAAVLVAVTLATIVAPSVARADVTMTIRASVAMGGAQGNAESIDPHVSADGRLVVFESDASNLVSGDSNGKTDIFLRDLVAGTTIRVSVSTGGAQANGDSGTDPIVSADGRYVAFPSYASNLVPGDTNGTRDVFVRDLVAGTTSRVSVSSSGEQGKSASFDPYVSEDGRFVTFSSKASNLVPGDTNGKTDVFVRDTVTGTTTRVSVATGGGQSNDSSEDAVVSDDGRFVAFSSLATNLVPGDSNGERDIFLHDRATGTTRRVSVSSSGAQGNSDSGYNPAISGDGRYVAFNSTSSNLVPGDTNGKRDVFVYEVATGAVSRVSVSTSGAQANGSSSSGPSLSRDGRFVAFLSSASNIVAGDTNGDRDVFLRDRLEGTTVRVSVAEDGSQSRGGDCFSQPYVNELATLVAFTCGATNLVAGDTNGVYDVFVRQLAAALPGPPDPTPPTAAVTAPGDGATVSGTVQVTVDAADGTGVARVDLAVDDAVVGTDTVAPYAFAWDTSALSSGAYVVVARAWDASGNTGDSPPVTVWVHNARTELVLTPVADATIRDDKPTTNYGSESEIGVDASPTKWALLRFDVQGVGQGTVESARLRLYATDPSGSGGSVGAVEDAWSARDVTWDTRPTLSPEAVASLGQVEAGRWYEFDVTALVGSDGVVNVGLTSQSTNGADYASREQAALAPQLVVVVAGA